MIFSKIIDNGIFVWESMLKKLIVICGKWMWFIFNINIIMYVMSGIDCNNFLFKYLKLNWLLFLLK